MTSPATIARLDTQALRLRELVKRSNPMGMRALPLADLRRGLASVADEIEQVSRDLVAASDTQEVASA